MSNTTRDGELILKLPLGAEVYEKVEQDEVITLFDSNGNRIVPEYVQVGLGYKKKNWKRKVTSYVRSTVDPISTNLYVLLSKYDRLYAIDTNKKQIDGVEYCVSCRMEIQMELKGHQQWQMVLDRLPSFIFTNPTVHEERIGWSQFIKQERFYENAKRIGIVTDHDLGNMPLYNLRKKEVLDTGFLSENIDFIYASAERDKNSPLNNAMKQCDADSNLLLGKIIDKKMNLSMLEYSRSQHFEKRGYLVPKQQKQLIG